jgi:uncharacterized protein with FMN-binding domain
LKGNRLETNFHLQTLDENMVLKNAWPVLLVLLLFIGCAAVKIVGGPVLKNSLKDGIYDGRASIWPVKVLARVTIQNQRITNINLIEHRNWKGGPAENIIPQRILDEQSTNVDAVSGATVSSAAIMNAVDNAVQMAK